MLRLTIVRELFFGGSVGWPRRGGGICWNMVGRWEEGGNIIHLPIGKGALGSERFQ